MTEKNAAGQDVPLIDWLESVTKIRDEQLEILHRNLRFADKTEDDKWAEISNAIAGAQALFVFKLDQLIQKDSNDLNESQGER